MPTPSVWRDSVRAKAYENEWIGEVDWLADPDLWALIADVENRIAALVLPHICGPRLWASFPLHWKEGTPIVPGGRNAVCGILRHALTSFFFEPVCHSWKGPEAPSRGRLNALAAFIDNVPDADFLAIFQALGFGPLQLGEIYVSPKYLTGWLRFAAALEKEKQPQLVGAA